MPLSKKGDTLLSKFVKRYGARGKSVFYATANSKPAFARAVGEPSKGTRK